MKTLTELSSFIESESFNMLDEETRKNVVLKLHEAILDICDQYGISDDSYEMGGYYQRSPDLLKGLTPIEREDMPKGYEISWILNTSIQGLIPLIRSKGKYGFFRPSFVGLGMGVDKYYSIKNPFRFDDVRICASFTIDAEYCYLATLEKGKWAVWLIDIDSHPLKMVEGCKSFDEAKREMEAIIGEPSPYSWTTFDDFGHGDFELAKTPDAHNPNAELIVTFPDGTVFDDDKAISTFVKTIQKIGFDEVAKVGIMIKEYNLVDTKERTDLGYSCQTRVGNYFVYSKLGNAQKAGYLNTISNYYNLGLKIDSK